MLTGIDTSGLYWWYPRNWVAPDGRIFGYSDRTMYYINPTGTGSLDRCGDHAGERPERRHLDRGDVRAGPDPARRRRRALATIDR